MRRPLLAFLVAFAVVAASGVMIAVAENARGSFDSRESFHWLGDAILALVVISIEAVVAAVITARRRRVREWLAAYVGVVLGVAPFFALTSVFRNASCAAIGYYLVGGLFTTGRAPCPPVPDVIGQTVVSVLLSALAAGLIFLVAGGLTYLAAGTSWQPTDREA
jgi:hypothetical protein